MPDITMCQPTTCPMKETCYRAQATPNSWQSYFSEQPWDGKKCDNYWKMEVQREASKTD